MRPVKPNCCPVWRRFRLNPGQIFFEESKTPIKERETDEREVKLDVEEYESPFVFEERRRNVRSGHSKCWVART